MDGIAVKGISYFTDGIPLERVRADLAVIRDDLHCNAVMLIGTDPQRQAEAARHALRAGMDVHIRPSLEDGRRADLLRHLAMVAALAEELRSEHPDRVTLLVGSEFSLTAGASSRAGGSSCACR